MTKKLYTFCTYIDKINILSTTAIKSGPMMTTTNIIVKDIQEATLC